jgi:membrane-bound metal-dependent hydrolase YbcI (DUF457 family)
MLAQALRALQNVQAQQSMIRRNHHRQLIIHSLIFYSIWIVLWLPAMIANYLDINEMNKSVGFAVVVASVSEIFADAIVSIFLDKRFAQAWKKFYHLIEHRVGEHLTTRVHPVAQVTVVHQKNTRSNTQT